jgi:hypothetical protein
MYYSRPERDQLQNCLDNALAEYENWSTANKHAKQPDASQGTKYINLSRGFGNETVKFIITTKFLILQIDNNVTSY